MKSLFISKKLLYRRQAGRLFCLLVMFILGATTITSTGYLIRSQKEYELNKTLTETGDYDVIIYDVPSNIVDEVDFNPEVFESEGSYLEAGIFSSPDCDVLFKGAIFKNHDSEQMYHMPCIRGSYPNSENEVALDISTAQALGITPYPGTQVVLGFHDPEGAIVNSKEYTVSGIFEASWDMVWCGWFRYPSDLYDEGEYIMPSIFFYDGLYNSFLPGNEVVMLQAEEDSEEKVLISEVNNIVKQVGNGAQYELNDFRANALASSMGILDDLEGEYGNVSYTSVYKAIDDGFGKKDFFSAVLIPVITTLILIIEVFAINVLVKAIIFDRKEYYGTFRLIGVTSIDVVRDILVEFSLLGFIGTSLGVVFGIILHNVMVGAVRSAVNIKIESGLIVSDAVKVVTFNPIVLSVVVCLLSLWFALLIPIIKIIRMLPMELMASDEELFVHRKKNRTNKEYKKSAGWLSAFCRRISLHDSLTMLTLAAVMSVMLFGYCYFRAYSDQSTSSYLGYLNESSMEGFDYVARRTDRIQDAPYMVSNRHSSGITHESIQVIEESEMTDELYAVIFNSSTRVVFDEEPDKELVDLLGNHNLKNTFDDTALGLAGEQGQAASLSAMGYDPSCYMYELPTVGIRERDLRVLNKYVVAGEIDVEAISSGKEVIVAIPEYLKDSALKYYNVGTTVNFSDVILSSDAEELNFNSAEAFSDRYKVYDTVVKDDYDNEICTIAAAYGKRHDITATIGAIVVLDDRLCNLYLAPDSKGVNYYYDDNTGAEIKSTTYGMALIVNDYHTFNSWGLPDSNYTCIKATIKSDVDINEYDQMWYRALSKSQNVDTSSSYLYINKVKSGTIEVMIIYYLISISLILLGAISVSVGLYAKVKSCNGDLMILRRIGLSSRQCGLMIISQNIYYPVMAVMISVIPVFMCQSMFSFIWGKLRSGEWASSYLPGEEPWYSSLPYSKNLFEYNFVEALLLCILIGVLLIVIGSIPQIRYLRKNQLIETEE